MRLIRRPYWEGGVPVGVIGSRGFLQACGSGGAEMVDVMSFWDGKNNTYGNWIAKPGPLANIPSRADVPDGSIYLVNEPILSGRKMRLLPLIADYDIGGAANWIPQITRIFANGGVDANPVSSITIAGGVGSYLMGTLIANLFTGDGLSCWGEVWLGRTAPIGGTFTVSITFAGITVSQLTGIVANANQTVRLPFYVTSRAAGSQAGNPQLAEWGQSNTAGVRIDSVTIDGTANVPIAVSISAGTNGDVVDIVAFKIFLG